MSLLEWMWVAIVALNAVSMYFNWKTYSKQSAIIARLKARLDREMSESQQNSG